MRDVPIGNWVAELASILYLHSRVSSSNYKDKHVG